MRYVLSFFLSLSVMLSSTPGTTQTYEETYNRLQADVASQFYQPGPELVETILREFRYYGQPDIGMNLTAATTYGVGETLFGSNYIGYRLELGHPRRGEQSAQMSLIYEIRDFIKNPTYLRGLWYITKGPATAIIINRVGPTRLQTWLTPAEPLLVERGFNPTFGPSYEDWRTNGCQWHLQIRPDQGYTPRMPATECAIHPFVAELTQATSPLSNSDFVNRAHWYGFLWRRYLEGDLGLVAVWQDILRNLLHATRN
jgi:hypothetical protein